MLVVAALAVWIGTYAHPQADDYLYSATTRDHGFLGAQWEFYQTWSGRLVANAACILALGRDMPLAVYRAMPAVLLFGLFLGFRVLIGALAPRGVTSGRRWLLGGALTLVYFTSAPSMREGFYWISGSLNYQPSHIIGLLLAGLLLRARPLRGTIVIAPVLAFMMALVNESAMLVEVLLLATGVLWLLDNRKRDRAIWLAALAGCVAGMVVDLTAPGLSARSAVYHGERTKDVSWALMSSFQYGGRTAVRVASNPAFWGTLVLGLPLLMRSNGVLRRQLKRRWLVIIPLAWLAAVAAATFPSQFATGEFAAGRVMNLAAWVFITGALPGVACIVSLALPKLKKLSLRRLQAVALVVVAVGVFTNTNCIRLIKDLPRAEQYDQQMRVRARTYHAAAASGQGHVRVAELQRKPNTISYHDQPADPNSWHNQLIARYYGLESVATVK